MRRFEIIDSEREGARPCAVLECDQARDRFSATVADWAGPNDVPVQFSPFVQRGERVIADRWVRAWVEERIAPPTRQNIGQILRAYGLDDYDACELLAHGEGRSTQDGFYLREISDDFKGAALLGRDIARMRICSGMTQGDLSERSGIRQETLSRIERGSANPTVKTLESIAEACGMRMRISFAKE